MDVIHEELYKLWEEMARPDAVTKVHQQKLIIAEQKLVQRWQENNALRTTSTLYFSQLMPMEPSRIVRETVSDEVANACRQALICPLKALSMVEDLSTTSVSVLHAILSPEEKGPTPPVRMRGLQ